jgi:hypothetical protein
MNSLKSAINMQFLLTNKRYRQVNHIRNAHLLSVSANSGFDTLHYWAYLYFNIFPPVFAEVMMGLTGRKPQTENIFLR